MTRTTVRNLGLAIALFAIACACLFGLRDRQLDGQLASDEPEWIAASILHWNQLVHGDEPAGADLRPGQPGDSAWKTGFQHTTFGYMNPCLPKVVWGGVLAAAGHRQASIQAFQTFRSSAPLPPAELRRAQRELLDAEPLMRRVVLVLAALSCVLMFFVVRTTFGGAAGWIAAAAAFALWIAAPLVRETATYIRTDHFMLPFCLGLWLWAVARSETFSGSRGSAALVRACAVAGVLAGLAVSSKLNGALAPIAFGIWVPIAWWLHRDDEGERASLAAVLGGLGLAALISFAVFVALNPLLWSDPFAGVADILARWDKLMGYFQDEWAPRTGVEVAHSLGERLSLFTRRTLERDEPLHALVGIPGVVPVMLGAVALVLAALRVGPFRARADARDTSERDRVLAGLCFASVFLVGTALWLPLDWPRLFLPAQPALIALEASLVALVVRLARSRAEAT